MASGRPPPPQQLEPGLMAYASSNALGHTATSWGVDGGSPLSGAPPPPSRAGTAHGEGLMAVASSVALARSINSLGHDPFNERQGSSPVSRVGGDPFPRTASASGNMDIGGSPPLGASMAAQRMDSLPSDVRAILDDELGRRGDGTSSFNGSQRREHAVVNPLAVEDEVLQRFKCAYEEVNVETRGPLRVTEDPVLSGRRRSDDNGNPLAQLRRRLTKKGRKKERHRRNVEQIRQNFPELTTLKVVRIQRTWRGYITRKQIAQIRKQGNHIADLGTKRVLRSAMRQGRQPHIADLPYRCLPLSIIGAYSSHVKDKSPHAVRVGKVLRHFVLQGGACPIFLLVILAFLLALVSYLLPGFVALVAKTIFYDGDSSLPVEQMASWLIIHTFVTGLLIAILMLMIVYEETETHKMFDFVLAVVGLKKARLMTMTQLEELRGDDLHVTVHAVYRNLPWGFIHAVHVLLGLFTIVVFDGALGFIAVLAIAFFTLVASLYDGYVSTQMHLTRAVSEREGILMHYARRNLDDECTSRNYQLGMAKTILRMTKTFSRVHGLVIATVGMTLAGILTLYIYSGAVRVQDGKLQLHGLVLCIVYFLFTLYSAYKLNENAAEYVVALRQMQRLLKVVWHFRDFAEDRTFNDEDCQIIAQTEGLAAVREQPRSTGLFWVWICGGVCMVVWLGYFGLQRGFLQCPSIDVRCEITDPDEGYTSRVNATDIAIRMNFAFSLWSACEPAESPAETLNTCARSWLRRLPFHNPPFRFTARIRYGGWRGDTRSFSKQFYTTSFNRVDVCPVYDESPYAVQDYFLSERTVANDTLVEGQAHGYTFDALEQPYFEKNRYRGCFAKQTVPEGALCTSARHPDDISRECWCRMGAEPGQPIDFDDPRCSDLVDRGNTTDYNLIDI